MKVILLQEIKGQGGEGDVVEVKRGYAVNYLFPKKMAIEASKGNLKQLELRKHNIAKREAERLDSADKVQAALTDKVLVIGARVGEEGQLFGSVTTQQIADMLGEKLGLEIDKRKIDLHAPIKKAGEHSVTVTVYRDIKAILTINVVSETELAKEEALKVDSDEEAVVEESAADEAVDADESAAGEAVDADESAADEKVLTDDDSVDMIDEAETDEQAEEVEALADEVETDEQAEEVEALADEAETDEQDEEAETEAEVLEDEEQAEDLDSTASDENDLDEDLEQ